MLKKSLGILLLLAASPAMADISYNYVDLRLQRIEFDDPFGVGVDIDGDGFGIGGSFEIGEDFFLQAGYGQADLDFGFDADELGLGIGYKTAISDRSDVFATLSYLSTEISASGAGSFDDDGFGISVGVRAMLTDALELNGALGYVDLDESGDNTSVSVGGLYSITDAFALGAGISFDDDATGYGIVGRFYFGN